MQRSERTSRSLRVSGTSLLRHSFSSDQFRLANVFETNRSYQHQCSDSSEHAFSWCVVVHMGDHGQDSRVDLAWRFRLSSTAEKCRRTLPFWRRIRIESHRSQLFNSSGHDLDSHGLDWTWISSTCCWCQTTVSNPNRMGNLLSGK